MAPPKSQKPINAPPDAVDQLADSLGKRFSGLLNSPAFYTAICIAIFGVITTYTSCITVSIARMETKLDATNSSVQKAEVAIAALGTIPKQVDSSESRTGAQISELKKSFEENTSKTTAAVENIAKRFDDVDRSTKELMAPIDKLSEQVASISKQVDSLSAINQRTSEAVALLTPNTPAAAKVPSKLVKVAVPLIQLYLVKDDGVVLLFRSQFKDTSGNPFVAPKVKSINLTGLAELPTYVAADFVQPYLIEIYVSTSPTLSAKQILDSKAVAEVILSE